MCAGETTENLRTFGAVTRAGSAWQGRRKAEAGYQKVDFCFPGMYISSLLTAQQVKNAGVVELVDTRDSKSREGDLVTVRLRPPAPENKGDVH